MLSVHLVCISIPSTRFTCLFSEIACSVIISVCQKMSHVGIGSYIILEVIHQMRAITLSSNQVVVSLLFQMSHA